ncbi:MAG: hypothetical protein ACI88C_000867 [Acidimicrobiales bacterium]|jgi:hypothetical protein
MCQLADFSNGPVELVDEQVDSLAHHWVVALFALEKSKAQSQSSEPAPCAAIRVAFGAALSRSTVPAR